MQKILLVSFLLILVLGGCTLFMQEEDKIVLPAEIRQWAADASASDSYGGIYGGNRDDQSAYAATGEPDVDKCDDSQRAWVASKEDNGEQWLELTFLKEVYFSKIRVRETFGPGAITKIELRNGTGYFMLWEGKDTNKACPGFFEVAYQMRESNITVNMTSFMTDKVRLTLDTDTKGWNEIDAVEITGYEQRWYFFNNTLVIE